jgi:quercetin dioxygenase-like cupin family protein
MVSLATQLLPYVVGPEPARGDSLITARSAKPHGQQQRIRQSEGAHGILTIRGGSNVRGWNGIRYKSGLSANNVGAKKLSMNVATIPPGGVAYAHIHVGFEVMLYILEGRMRHEYGPALEHSLANQRRLHLHRARRASRGLQH